MSCQLDGEFLENRKRLKSGIWFLFFPKDITGGSVQFSSVAHSCPTLCDPMDCSMLGLPVHHQLPEFT